MPKHNKRRDRHEMAEVREAPPVSQPPGHPPPLSPAMQETWPNLARVRNAALNARSDAQRTILELEAWRDELDATLAFLRAHRR
jgi:hypothetical protein